jgi:hypothetical protein
MTEDLIIQIAPGRMWNNDPNFKKEMPALFALTEKGNVLFYNFKHRQWVELGGKVEE